MGLSNKREEHLKQMPLIDSRVLKSKDGKFLVHKTTITHIKPVQYYQAVLDGDVDTEEAEMAP